MNQNTAVIRKAIGSAVFTLRKRMHWNQVQLARELKLQSIKLGVATAPDRYLISRWEHGIHAPSPDCRMALSRLAERNKRTRDLAGFFRMRIEARHLTADRNELPPVGGSKDGGRASGSVNTDQ